MQRFPELRLDEHLARLVDARLVEGQTWSSLVREALTAYLDMAPSKSRRRRRRPVAGALNVALKAQAFEDWDAAAVGLARSLADRLDEYPSDAKYLAQRLLATLVELRLTPAARLGVLAASPEPMHPPGVLEQLRLHSACRQAGEMGLFKYLWLRDDRNGYHDEAGPYVDAVTRALQALTEAVA